MSATSANQQETELPTTKKRLSTHKENSLLTIKNIYSGANASPSYSIAHAECSSHNDKPQPQHSTLNSNLQIPQGADNSVCFLIYFIDIQAHLQKTSEIAHIIEKVYYICEHKVTLAVALKRF